MLSGHRAGAVPSSTATRSVNASSCAAIVPVSPSQSWSSAMARNSADELAEELDDVFGQPFIEPATVSDRVFVGRVANPLGLRLG